jgi:hypothetical protein
MAAALSAVVGIGAAVLFGVHLPTTVDGGYVLSGNGKAFFVTTNSVDQDVLRTGGTVEFSRAGLAGRVAGGAAVLDGTSVEAGSAPLLAFVPVSDIPIEVPANRLPLTVTDAPGAPVGAATILGPEVPLWQWLSTTYIAPVFRW